MILLNAESDGYSEPATTILRALGEVRLRTLRREQLLAALADVDILIIRLANQIDAEVLAAAPNLKVIVSATTGLNHIDLATAKNQNITVLSLRGETEFLSTISATAEHTWALLLALVRNLPAAVASVTAGEWVRDCFRGHELNGKTLGIVGLGRLGGKVAQYASAFGMRVHAYDPYRKHWPTNVTRIVDLNELCAGADVLSLHMPLDETTTKMISERQLSQLPRGAILVNTSRGEVIDEAALITALENRILAGAALDVVSNEIDHLRGEKQSALIAWAALHPQRLIITPHIGGATLESMHRTEVFMAQKLAAHLRSARYVGYE
ncbi:MAG: NAD(P)-dependent oxidoreductase [Burkholderiaceae bacterium]